MAEAEVLEVPRRVLWLARLAGDDGSTRYDLTQVRFGRDVESAFAIATESHVIGVARWGWGGGPPVAPFGVPARALLAVAESTEGAAAGREPKATLSHEPGRAWRAFVQFPGGSEFSASGAEVPGRFPDVGHFDREARAGSGGAAWPASAGLGLLALAFETAGKVLTGGGMDEARVRGRAFAAAEPRSDVRLFSWEVAPPSPPDGLKLWLVLMPIAESDG
jgi:hypothetical protein